ncbi:saccharopine dehydrogenase NADP-binding domain-containing protein [Mesorhizobium sp. CAU 1741]|uniref:saccharopine dehydrogenase family protein n=1 Tax=Mesorhizobium sp. CAU 1741 TaxID=3140366 RepID=UPI00325BBBEB
MAGAALTVAIVGAGNVGLALARMLVASGDYAVRAADCTEEAVARAAGHGIDARLVDASSSTRLGAFLEDADFAVAAVPDRIVPRVAMAARGAGCHYIDFSIPDSLVASLAEAPGRPVFLPGCGVSPGLADGLVASLAAEFEEPVDVELAVGAIPTRRTNRLGYSLIWNLDGLFAEYTSPCEAISDFALTELPPLSKLTAMTIDGTDYEAFCTAGMMGSMRPLAGGNVRSLICRTIRYPGHLDYMLLLLDDLRLRQRRDLLHTVLKSGLRETGSDMVLLHASARAAAGPDRQRQCTVRIDASPDYGNALAVGSAAHAASLLDQIRTAQVRDSAWRPNIFADVLDSRFAKGIIQIERAVLEPALKP